MKPTRFSISYQPARGQYTVSIPNYNGGEVVTAEYHDQLVYELSVLRERIQDYLGNGGLFNPEMMEHDKVRGLLLDIKEAIDNARRPRD